MSKRLTRDLPLVKLLNISITLSPFLGVDTKQFHTSIMDGTEAFWLSLPSAPQGHLVRSDIQEELCLYLKRQLLLSIVAGSLIKITSLLPSRRSP